MHDDRYSLLSHHHDTAYSAIGHNHDLVYAAINHAHNYAAHDHAHNNYAAINHNHDSVYAAANHVHPYAPATHSHSEYVSATNLGLLLDEKVDYNSLGMILNSGYEQIDANIARVVSVTTDQVVIKYYANNEEVMLDFYSKQYIDTALLNIQNQFNTIAMQTGNHDWPNHAAPIKGCGSN